VRLPLRLIPVLALAFLALGTFGGSAISASSPPKVDPFLGDWTASAASDAPLAGKSLTISLSTKAGAKEKVGPQWTNASGTGYYDQYCGSGATVYAYVRIAYHWAPVGQMGGCISNKTGAQIVFAGLHRESGSVHIAVQSSHLDSLAGTWNTIDNGQCCDSHNLDADRATVHYAVSEQGQQPIPPGGHGAKFPFTKLHGSGLVGLQDTIADGAYGSAITGANGTIHFRKWRQGAHGVIDEYRIVLKVKKAYPSHYHQNGNTGLASIRAVAVVVAGVESTEKAYCPIGGSGTMSMYEANGADVVDLQLSCCDINASFTNGERGAQVGVQLTPQQP
jgi:hypothetical protein